MFKKGLLALLAWLLMGSWAWAGPSIDMEEGLWEIHSSMKMEGVQGMTIPPTTYTQCITQEDLVPRNDQPGQECEITDVQVKGNTVSWVMKCSGQGGNVEGTGSITYNGDRFEGTMEFNMPGGMRMTGKTKGKRIGDCK
jgi:hypothetical protein